MENKIDFLDAKFIYPQLQEGWAEYVKDEFECLIEPQYIIMKDLSEGKSFEECYTLLKELADTDILFHTTVKGVAYFSKDNGLNFAKWLKENEPGYKNNTKYYSFLEFIEERNEKFDAELVEGKTE